MTKSTILGKVFKPIKDFMYTFYYKIGSTGITNVLFKSVFAQAYNESSRSGFDNKITTFSKAAAS